MRRKKRRYRHKKQKKSYIYRAKMGICLLCCLFLMGYLLVFANKVIRPAMASVAEVRVKSIISKTVNEAVAEEFTEKNLENALLEIKTTAAGNVSMIKADTVVMNQLASSLTNRIQDKMRAMTGEDVKVPLGSLLGSQILSQMGPYVKLKIIPMGMAKINFKTEFEGSGINQTRHRIYLEVDSTARLLAPFSLGVVEIKNEILVAETVIVGDVPQSYIFVPEQDLLDGYGSTN